jgi:myo-inositol-1(or 4)-monophosphatase
MGALYATIETESGSYQVHTVIQSMFPESLIELTALICETADRELPSRFGCHSGSRKADGSLVTEADIVVQAALFDALKQRWPDTDVLGEEMDESAQQRAMQHSDTGLWVLDPLDGTTNFSNGVPYYAVSAALLRNGVVEQGVVYDPNRKECFAAARKQGAWLNGERLQHGCSAPPLAQGVALIDLKRLPKDLACRLASNPPYKSQRSFGAVALDWAWLAAGRFQVYLHGRQKLWDYAAGCLILEEAGGCAVTLEGKPVFAPTLQPRSAAAALDPAAFQQWIDWLGITRG